MPPQDPTEHADYPGQPPTVTGETAFRLDRWQRAGASDEEVAALRDHHSTLAPNQRAFEATAIDSTSDNELTEVLETMRNAEDGPAFTALTLTERPGPGAPAEPEPDSGGSGEEKQPEKDDETPGQRAAREAAEAKAAAEAEASKAAAEAAKAKGQGGGPEQ